MNSTLAKVLKGFAGVLVLLVLISTVSRWWGDYRTSASPEDAAVTTTTAPPEGEGAGASGESGAEDSTESAPKPKTVVVLTDGLNFRQEPSRDAKVIRGLKGGEKLVLIKTDGGWYQVETEDGTRGWISANPTYSEVQ